MTAGRSRNDPSAEAEAALSYRRPMEVREILVLVSGAAYPVCPRCARSLEREYMGFCDRCGQCLSWERFHLAVVTRR